MTVTLGRGLISGIVFSCMLLAQAALAQDNPPAGKEDKGGATADKQKPNKADLEMTKKIRQAVMKDKTLSMEAHNVKIISQDGQVTLRGSVRSEDEKKAIADKATEIAGAGKVDNQLEVSATPPSDQK